MINEGKAVKEENIDVVRLDEEVELDGRRIWFIKFDLKHINYGWNKELHDYNHFRRSHYKRDDIVEFFEQLGLVSIEWEEGVSKHDVKLRGEKRTRYYSRVYDHQGEQEKKMVIDISEDFIGGAVIVTIF